MISPRPSPRLTSALLSLLIPATSLCAQARPTPLDPGTVVHYRLDGRDVPVSSGAWIPADADLRVALSTEAGAAGRGYRLEVMALDDGERAPVEVAGIQEYDRAARKWVHIDLAAAQAVEGRWIWAGTFRPGDVVTLRWRETDSGQVVPHPVILRIVDRFGARLAFATPVSVVFPVTGEPTAAASAGFAVRYYRVSNSPFWRTMDRLGFPAVGFAYAEIAGEKSILYSIGVSAIDDQLHLYYGGFRNDATANNFWMLGFSLKTSDLMAAVKRAIR